MNKQYKFSAVIKKLENMDAAYIEFPYNVETEFGTKGQVKVKASFDGVQYRGSLANMGLGCHSLGILKEIRKKIGKDGGDTVEVIIEKDLEKREVVLPAELELLFTKNKKLKSNFEKLSYTNKKEIVLSISSAKKEETKEKRLKLIIEKLGK